MIYGLGQEDSLSAARARVEALKRKIQERQSAPAPSEPVKTMTNGNGAPPPPPRPLPPAPVMRPEPHFQAPRPPQQNGVKNYMALLGVGLVAGLAVVILQRAFRRS